MFLITSAAYVNAEFINEFGRLPPAFLPLQNIRLFQHQISEIKNAFPGEEILLSLPISFEVPEKDALWLKNASVKLIFVEDNLSLGESVLQVLRVISSTSHDSKLRLLHGDTLLPFPKTFDVIAVSDTSDDYTWEVDRISDMSF